MAIRCEFIDLIIPISNINRVYPGGFVKFKQDFIEQFSGKLWHDEYLFRDGAMNPLDIQDLIEYWERRGLVGIKIEDGIKKSGDFCVFQSMLSGPTLPCDWLKYNIDSNTVEYIIDNSK